MKKITVLLTAAGGFGTPGTINCLKNNDDQRQIRIICSDMVNQSIANYKADRFYILPKGNSKNYLKSLIKICKKEKVNVILPGSSPEIITISKNIRFLNSKNIFATVPKYEILKNVLNKSTTYEILERNKIRVPKFYRVKNLKEFCSAIKFLGYPKNPICFKPADYLSSGGARGFRVLRKNNSLEKTILKNKPGSVEIDYKTTMRLVSETNDLDLLVMEYLPGEEFSVYVLANKGKMQYCVPQLRTRVEQHYSFEAIVKNNKKITQICEKITKLLNLDYNANIQFRLSKTGQPKIIEINPRMGGSIPLTGAAGANLPYFGIKQALNEKLPRKKIIFGTQMIRYWKEFFVNESKSFE